MLYYRPLLNLLPGSALRRSETNIARQIFNELTQINNEENAEIESDIAHHWQQTSPLHWRFFLRPAIRFHHGRELEMADVITTLERQRQRDDPAALASPARSDPGRETAQPDVS